MKIVQSKFTKKYWLATDSARVSPKFRSYLTKECGPFTRLRTDKFTVIYHSKSEKIMAMSQKSDDVSIKQIAMDIFAIFYYKGSIIFDVSLYNNKATRIAEKLSDIRPVCNGLIAAKRDNEWGFIDKKKQWLVEPIYAQVTDFNEAGYSIVTFKSTGKKAVIDKKGNYVMGPSNYSNATFITDNCILVSNGSCKKGVIDCEGNIIVPVLYDSIETVGEYFKVRNKKRYGLVDRTGNVLLECIYPEIIEMEDKFVVEDFAKKEVHKEIKK